MSETERFEGEQFRRVRYHFGDRSDGDAAQSPPSSTQATTHVSGHPATTLTQVHGADVLVVDAPGAATGATGDALVTDVAGAALCVRTADCVPIVIAASTVGSDRLIVAAVHAGWRGLYAGVLEATVAVMAGLGAQGFVWSFGPCISPWAYEFSPADLTTMALRFGPEVVAASSSGAPALDLHAAVRAAANDAGLGPDHTACPSSCTATALDERGLPLYWSWRARADPGRQLSSVWIEP